MGPRRHRRRQLERRRRGGRLRTAAAQRPPAERVEPPRADRGEAREGAAAEPDPAAQGALSAAEAAYKEGRYADARAEYAKLLALRPDLAPRIHQQIGFAWIQEKQHAKAVEELKQVLAAEPDNHRVRAIAAQAALEGGMLEEGRSLLDGAPDGQRA